MIELNREERSAQNFSVITSLNRINVVEIKLKRSDQLSDGLASDLKEIRNSIHDLTDSVIIGEDVRSSLNMIVDRIAQVERKVNA